MQKRLRDLLRVLVADLRHTLSGGPNGQRGDLDRELERLGIAPDGTVTPFDALPNPTPAERWARRVVEAQLAAAPAARRAATRAEVVERAAYTWINRLLALRAAEARGLINEILRSDPAYDGLSEALFILRQTHPQRAAGPDGGWWAVIEDACRAQAASLPGLFDLADPSAALRPSVPALLRCVAIVGNSPAGYTADEAESTFADPDAIGWAYQFYQEEAKARTYAMLNSGGKAATRAEIAAVTQLFTEPYMVKWLLQNSLGRLYHELYPNSLLPETWEYYVRISGSTYQPGSEDSPIRSLADLTFMDPCSGSGHIEREAFDMFAAMYREQYPDMSATEIADLILTRHLHGIDLDPRAAQLTALTLYLRAWELVRDERRVKRLTGAGAYQPPAMNLATTPTGLTPGSLERHLQRHPEDRIYRPLLEGIFAALEQADILGSLLRPGEQLDAAIQKFRTQGGGQLSLLAGDDDLNRLLGELARHDPGELKRVLLERVARSFAAEAADADDVAMALFGQEAGEGLRLLQLLDHKYTTVATNPPYMGSKNMSPALKKYTEEHYFEGRRDLYTAFIICCYQLCCPGGRIAMIAQQSWAFLSSFASLRAMDETVGQGSPQAFRGVLVETSMEAIAHLGRYAFSEIGNAAVAPLMFVTYKTPPATSHRIWACRLSARRPSEEQAALLLAAARAGFDHELVYDPVQHGLLSVPGSPLVYWVGDETLKILVRNTRLSVTADVVEGLGTRWDARFLRMNSEVPQDSTVSTQGRWVPFVKGGGYYKWTGRQWYCLDWKADGARILNFKDDSGKLRSRPQNRHYYFSNGLTYSAMAQGSLAVRKLEADTIAGDAGPMIVPRAQADYLAGVLNSRFVSYVLRMLSPTLQLKTGYVALTPLPVEADQTCIAELAEICTSLKAVLISSDLTERKFDPQTQSAASLTAHEQDRLLRVSAVLSCLEGILERQILNGYGLTETTVGQILSETGFPAGFRPLIHQYDHLPPLSEDAPLLPPKLEDQLQSHTHGTLTLTELIGVKATLSSLYEAGPGTSKAEPEESEQSLVDADEEAESISGAYIPVPAETFLEELSQKLQVHPVSIYWLLEELRAEGVRCKPEELRLLEDKLSVHVLLLLGHRWPRQIEAGEPVPSWADPDGIVPLTAVAGEASLAERVRDRLRAEDGDRGAQQVEALLLELTGQSLDEWLRRNFFVRHVRQFKHRPIAWHLASTPTKDGGRRKAKREPAFQCLLYYQACRGDVLARLRAHYVEPLIRLETAAAAEARRRGDETAAAIAVSRVQELEEFAARLREVEETGFACAELDRLLAEEPLDRWSGDGIVPPTNADELAAQERAWRVDINDGVRVNIAPLQLAGLLTSDVLRPDDARKAIADRARWRSDERRWVREGVLPRCGWMDEDVPESPRWTERAPEREAEQRKLEEKRRAVMGRLAGQAEELS